MASGQDAKDQQRSGVIGSGFSALKPQQQKLLQRWVDEYQKITGKKLAPATAYAALTDSERTTFEAITHALMNTKLTDKNGRSLGTALDLVRLVEAVAGKTPGIRGDHQFRMYVLLKRDALDRLYASREFQRRGDNTHYHIGYPINFRQTGRTPTIQISVARTGFRADIDVDYRSSHGPIALVNGHLTAANSDVRAGNNYERHVNRWSGLVGWWRNLLGLFAQEEPTTAVTLDSTLVSTKPKVTENRPLYEAVEDFYRTWLIDQKPEIAFAYYSVRSYPCVAQYHEGVSPDSPLVRIRVLEHLRKFNTELGQVKDLKEVLQPVSDFAPGAKLVKHPMEKLFAMEHVTEDVAFDMYCSHQLHLKLAVEESKPSKTFGNHYGAITRLVPREGKGVVVTQLWGVEEGHWKILSWELDDRLSGSSMPDQPAVPVQQPAGTANKSPADPQLIESANGFYSTWLLRNDYDSAVEFFAPEAYLCGELEAQTEGRTSSSGSGEALTKAYLKEVGEMVGPSSRLEDIIRSPEFGHAQVQKLPHFLDKVYLLGRVSDDIASMSNCQARAEGRKIPRGTAEGKPSFSGNHFETAFTLKNVSGTPGVIAFTWAKRGSGWKIIAYEFLAD